jgi:hypothetical protein
MLGSFPARANGFSFERRLGRFGSRAPSDRWQLLAQSAILILGSPRSGTSWLAKIFDSHPEILYRHEPDELVQAAPTLSPAEQVKEWLKQRGLRAAAKRPNFPKSWRPAPLNNIRTALIGIIAVAQRTPTLSHAARKIHVPDLVAPSRWGSVRAMVKLVNWDGSLAARTMPDTRCVFILRHPCGQIASVMAGLAARQFARSPTPSEGPVDLTAAAALAASRGVCSDAFNALPDAAKFAWNWRAFNEPAIEALGELPNAKIVVYEDLCRRPEAVARDLFAFAGLGWHDRTTEFLGTSTHHDRPAGYYDVFRSTEIVADRWRQTMSQQDQDAVRTVLSASPLARCWPDLAALAG